jgi:amino acid adenylation domain-containing protein
MPGDTPHSVVTRIGHWATSDPARIALIGADRTLNFAEMSAAANRLAHALLSTLGTCTGFVAICLPPTTNRIVAALGILRAGLGYVPIDPRLHDAGRRDLAAHAGVLGVVTDTSLFEAFAPDHRVIDIENLGASGPDDDPGIHPGPDAPAYLRYTSGSTGAPKGVLHNHRAALGQGLAFGETVGLQPGDRVGDLHFFPHAVILGTLALGAAHSIIDPTASGLRIIAARLRRDRVSLLSCFPSMLRALAPAMQADGPLPHLRAISLSGEPVIAEDVNLALRCVAPGGVAINNYGSSEFVQISSHQVHREIPHGTKVPTGRPPSGVELRLTGPDGEALPPGEAGEIAVRAAFMSSGYWRRPDLSRAVFGSDTPQDGRTFYRTGDIGRMDEDGCLTVLGRTDNQIKLRAYRITPEEIEAVLLQHPEVAAAAVRPFTDHHGTEMLAAFIVPRPGMTADIASLRAHARAHLPPHMVPSAFIGLAELPTTPGGKLDRAALPDPLPLWRAQTGG